MNIKSFFLPNGGGGAGGGGAWEVVADEVVSGGSVNEIAVSGLDLDADGVYKIIAFVKVSTADTIEYRINGDSSASNYKQNRTRAEGGSITSASLSSNNIAYPASFPKTPANFDIQLSKISGEYPTGIVHSQSGTTGTPRRETFAIAKTNTANVTSFSLNTDSGSAYIENGSRLIVLKLAS